MEKPNIILIVCDTLRKDVLELYGGEAKTPNLNKLAKDAMVYENCIAPSPWTFPSHVSLFTGLYPHEHGVHEEIITSTSTLINLNEELKVERLPQYFKKIGYNTIGISNNMMVSRFTNFDKGFDYFSNIEPSLLFNSKEIKEAFSLGATPLQIAQNLIKNKRIKNLPKYVKEFLRFNILSKAMNYPLDKGAILTNSLLFNTKLSKPFFLFMNYFELHEPYKKENKEEVLNHYTGIKSISDKSVKHLKQEYIKEVEYLDKNLGEFIQTLIERNLYDNTIIIVTSDHGQAFNEHGYMYHEIYLYDELITIPLIIKYPNNKKFIKKKGYQNLVNVQTLIKDILNGKDDKQITTPMVISESYGIAKLLPESYKNRKKYVIEKYGKSRKAIYRNGFKLTINGTDGIIEEFLKNGKPKDIKSYKSDAKKLVQEFKYVKERDFKLPNELMF